VSEKGMAFADWEKRVEAWPGEGVESGKKARRQAK
jgi:hypothetical protein